MIRSFEISLPIGPDGSHTAFSSTLIHFYGLHVEQPERGLFRFSCCPTKLRDIADHAMSYLPDVDHVQVLDIGSGIHDTFKRQHRARHTGDDR
jgi:hypothetical protein